MLLKESNTANFHQDNKRELVIKCKWWASRPERVDWALLACPV
jgi:hypothetical protein